jgi:radical SAM protein with 4Fe4S-binding SPASM domain
MKVSGYVPPQLEHLDIELTRQCNNDCIHCSTGARDEGLELTLEGVKQLLDTSVTLGLRKVGFTGGEPFQRQEMLMDLLEYSSQTLGLSTHVHSNGTIIGPGEAIKLKGFNAEITVSLFSADPKTHDAITRRSGSFIDTIRGLKCLIEAGADVSVYFVPIKHNFKGFNEVINLVEKIGCRKMRILSLSPTGKALSRYDDLQLDENDVSYLNKMLQKFQSSPVKIAAGFCTRITFPGLTTLKGHDSCYTAKNRLHIDSHGNIYPCTAASGRVEFSAGNVRGRETEISQIWRSSPFLQLLRRFHVNRPDKCRKCERYDNCMGGCRIVNYYKYGDVSVINPICTLVK